MCGSSIFTLAGSSWGVVCLMICWNVNATCANLSWKICRMDMSGIYFDLWSGRLRNFCVWMICSRVDVVCCGRINGSNLCMWNVRIVSYFWGGCDYPCVMTWSGSYISHDDLAAAMSVKMWLWPGMDFTCPYLHGGDLATWPGMMAFVWSWVGGALMGFPKEVPCVDNPWQCDHTHHNSKHLMLGQFLAIRPCPWHWKQWYSSFDIMLTVDCGIIMAVSCCTALSFSTSDIASLSICGPFSQMWVARLWAFFKPLMNILMVGCNIYKVASLSFCLELVEHMLWGILFLTAGSPWNVPGVGMNIGIAKF